MASADQITDMVALLLFQNIKEGMQNGRVADLNAAKNEVDSAMAELNRRRLPEERAYFNVELVAQLIIELGSMREKVTKCEAQLADFENQAKLIKEDTTQLVARAEACTLLAQQQQKENVKVLAAMEDAKASAPTTLLPHCAAPATSPIDPILRAAPSRTAVVSFPGGPRTITIHPPHSPNHQSVIRDETGDVIIDFRRAKPLRREGAFRGALEDINWHEITRVRGRAPELSGIRAPIPPVPRWPDRAQTSASGPPSSCTPADIISRQRQLSTSLKTDSFKRIIAPEYLADINPPSQSSNGSSSTTPRASQDSQSPSSGKQDVFVTPLSTPPSPSAGRGKKRTRDDEDDSDSGVLLTANAREEVSRRIGQQAVGKEPTTPTPVKREESHSPEGPAKRKKLCFSTPSEALQPSGSGLLTRTRSMLDVTQAI